jgi:hypothetical protein
MDEGSEQNGWIAAARVGPGSGAAEGGEGSKIGKGREVGRKEGISKQIEIL